MLNVHQLRQLAEQTAKDATTATGRVGIFDDKLEAGMRTLALGIAEGSLQLHSAVSRALEAAEKAETPA